MVFRSRGTAVLDHPVWGGDLHGDGSGGLFENVVAIYPLVTCSASEGADDDSEAVRAPNSQRMEYQESLTFPARLAIDACY